FAGGRRLPLQRFAQLAGGRRLPLQRVVALASEQCDLLFVAGLKSLRSRPPTRRLSRAALLRLVACRSTSGHHFTQPAKRWPEIGTPGPPDFTTPPERGATPPHPAQG